ncbi:MAG: diguanylate cyclase [Polyangiales bacterium]
MTDESGVSAPSKTVVTSTRSIQRSERSRDACIVVIYGENIGTRLPLGQGEMTIGRTSTCTLQIDQESVSRTHCKLYARDGRFYARDLNSTNGTYVNDELINEIDLRDGDQLKVGRTILKFISGGNIEGQYHEEIYRLMTIDALTQLHNKRHFEEHIAKEVARSHRYRRPVSVIVFDIDHFKSINDTYGHLAGDAVLRQLGTVVLGRIRSHDVASRIGGEEFAVILPEVDLKSAAVVAQGLCQIVRETVFDFEGNRIDVTISLGVAQWSNSLTSHADLVAAADSKLYEAKRGGRNRVCA